MYSPEYILNVVEHTDMAALAGRYTRLTPRDHATLVGRCPVHGGAQRSFTVDTGRGVCGCSVCGRAWGVVDLVREVEHTDFNGAVALLASRAGIAPPDDAPAPTPAEAMFAANEMASDIFARTLTETEQGRAIGLAYLRGRGISDEMVREFRLGFSPEESTAVHQELLSKGVSGEVLVQSGLSVATDRGTYYDRYHSRVVYPVLTVAGRTVAFGARTLRTDKNIAKYVNSPESSIYSKSNELYGLFQAREAIVEKGYAIMVEGYMDVISMHQAGVRNVVASSGTSLTTGQVKLLRQFTDRVTVIYDADPAGIKAALRSVDMLLTAGIDMRAVLLPDGEDPDSFARSHTPEETERYLDEHALNMVDYRLSLLPPQVMADPVERTRALGEIIESIALVADDNRRRQLIATCRNRRDLRMSESAIVTQVSRLILRNAQNNAEMRRRSEASRAFDDMEADMLEPDTDHQRSAYLRPYELNVVRLAVKYGIMYVPDASAYTPEGDLVPMTVAEMIWNELTDDDMTLSNADLRQAIECVMEVQNNADTLAQAYARYDSEANAMRDRLVAEGYERLRQVADLTNIEAQERRVTEEASEASDRHYAHLCSLHVAHLMMVCPSEPMRRIAADALHSTYRISTIYTRANSSSAPREEENLAGKIMLQIYCLKYATVLWQIHCEHEAIRRAGDDFEAIRVHMEESQRLGEIKKMLARTVGDRVIAPGFQQ